jgi:glyoxylase-like metal-dependent hydrolase (beta-lactamase superfamily II)
MKKKLAKVKILLIGYFEWLGINKCRASSTVTLIEDNGKKIIVDTGSRARQKELLRVLALEGLKPQDIDYVVITHPHTDHLENLGLFTKAISLNIFEEKEGDIFLLSSGMQKGQRKNLTPNVLLAATPGHTNECITALVKTERGIVAVAGDLFVKRQIEKVAFVDDPKTYQKSRAKIIKLADYIIPGHGGEFEVKK